MERVLRYFALAFFFAFPAVFFPPDWTLPVFSSVLFPFWESFGLSLYEGVKLVFLSLFAVAFSLGTLSLKYREISLPKVLPRSVAVLFAVILFWWSSWANPGFPLFDAVAWKTYSVLPFLALFAVAFSMSAYDSGFQKASIAAFVFGFLGVNFPYAVLQVLWYDPFSASAVLPWETGRAFWTLGNPNSLAFLAASSIPLAYAFLKKGPYRRVVIASALGIVIMSGSWSGMAVSVAYLSYRYFGAARTAAFSITAVFVAAIVSSVAWSPYQLQEKRLSFSTRAAIVWDAATLAVSNPHTFFSGDGAWAVETSFSRFRSAELANRVDSSVPIDRTHFFILDVALVFWMPFALALFALGILAAQKTERPVREALSVLFVMSCLHTPASAHLLFTVLLLVSGLRVPKKPAVSVWKA